MRIGVVSDTHGLLRPQVFEVFDGVDRIVHCGDVGTSSIMDRLAQHAPLSVAFGNTDGFEVRSRSSRVVRLELEWHVVVALHGDQYGVPTPSSLREEFPHADVIMFGHTHESLIEKPAGNVVVVNPGAAGSARYGRYPSVAIVEIAAGSPPKAQIVPLDPSC